MQNKLEFKLIYEIILTDIPSLSEMLFKIKDQYNQHYKNQLSTCIQSINFKNDPICFQVWSLDLIPYFRIFTHYSNASNHVLLFNSLEQAIINFNNQMLKYNTSITWIDKLKYSLINFIKQL